MIRDDPRERKARFTAANRLTARESVETIERRLPAGYSLELESIRKARAGDGRSKGARCAVTVVIRHVDRREPEISVSEWGDIVGF